MRGDGKPMPASAMRPIRVRMIDDGNDPRPDAKRDRRTGTGGDPTHHPYPRSADARTDTVWKSFRLQKIRAAHISACCRTVVLPACGPRSRAPSKRIGAVVRLISRAPHLNRSDEGHPAPAGKRHAASDMAHRHWVSSPAGKIRGIDLLASRTCGVSRMRANRDAAHRASGAKMPTTSRISFLVDHPLLLPVPPPRLHLR